ncbi:MAG TPA: PilX N-terminal domain-containing pilus assembly protein [Oxalicibacterium sp.]
MMKQVHIYGAMRAVRMRGFSLVSAIFLLIVLAALGVAMVTISTTQHQSSSLDIEGVRAYQAAKAGIEWGVYQQLRGSSGSCPTSFQISGFTVVVTCIPGEEGTAVITSKACNIPVANVCDDPAPNNPDYVRRVVEVRL